MSDIGSEVWIRVCTALSWATRLGATGVRTLTFGAPFPPVRSLQGRSPQHCPNCTRGVDRSVCFSPPPPLAAEFANTFVCDTESEKRLYCNGPARRGHIVRADRLIDHSSDSVSLYLRYVRL